MGQESWWQLGRGSKEKGGKEGLGGEKNEGTYRILRNSRKETSICREVEPKGRGGIGWRPGVGKGSPEKNY